MTTTERAKLVGLARNPATPDNVLERLAEYEPAANKLPYRLRALPDRAVQTILDRRKPAAVAQLGARAVSPRMLAVIAADPDPAIRNARSDFLRQMAEQGVHWPLDDLEEVFGPRSAMAQDPDPAVRQLLARTWWDRPAEVHAALLTDPDQAVRAAAAGGQQDVPVELQAAFLADPDTRASVAQYARLTEDLAMALATDPDVNVRSMVAENPGLPPAVVALLAEDAEPSVRGSIVLHQHLDAATRDRLYAQLAIEVEAGSQEAWIALEFTLREPDWVRDEPLPARLAYLESPHLPFRRALAESQDLPPEAWLRLDRDPDQRVRHNAALRPNAPAALLEAFVRRHGLSSRNLPALTDHPCFPREKLATFADAPDPHVREAALLDPALPRHLLARLVADPQARVRRVAAAHPALDETLFGVLLDDEDEGVVEAAAKNPALPVSWMHRILDAAGF